MLCHREGAKAEGEITLWLKCQSRVIRGINENFARNFVGCLGLGARRDCRRAEVHEQQCRAKANQCRNNNAPNSDEQRLLAAIPQLQWTQEYMISNGWLKPGQQVFEKANNFSRKNYGLFGLTGSASSFKRSFLTIFILHRRWRSWHEQRGC